MNSNQIVHPGYFSVNFRSVPSDRTLGFDLYLSVNKKVTLFRLKGDSLGSLQENELIRQGGGKFLIPVAQQEDYSSAIRGCFSSSNVSKEEKLYLMKEVAFLHVNDLFTEPNIANVLKESRKFTEEIIGLISSDIQSITALAQLSTHESHLYNHSVNVAVYSISIGRLIYGDNEERLLEAGFAGLLHDLGKKRIPTAILTKTGELTAQEWSELRRTPTYGYEYVKEMYEVPDASKRAIYEHSEHFDGTGYPRGLLADEISQLARIVSVADVFDVLTSKTSYNKPVPPKQAALKMESLQPGRFDPEILDEFLQKTKGSRTN